MPERTAATAQAQLDRYEVLAAAYGMRLPSVAERLGERFVQPLMIERIRALVEPAMAQWNDEEQSDAFRLLEEEVAQFTSEPSGVGFETPAWLEALELEVDGVRMAGGVHEPGFDAPVSMSRICLAQEEAMRQIDAAEKD